MRCRGRKVHGFLSQQRIGAECHAASPKRQNRRGDRVRRNDIVLAVVPYERTLSCCRGRQQWQDNVKSSEARHCGCTLRHTKANKDAANNMTTGAEYVGLKKRYLTCLRKML